MHPIGVVRRAEDAVQLEISKPYRAGLKQLDQFSHVIVFWWADKVDTDELRSIMVTDPPYAPDHTTGVFACRSEYRPNPLAVTTCRIEGVSEQEGIVRVTNIDAFDGTRIVDLKAYFPVCDRVKEAWIPQWLSDWPEWMPEDGLGLE
jgi:tRNA-Thr(GGU) m(6)t(6)A37 methyltransferase TsaA